MTEKKTKRSTYSAEFKAQAVAKCLEIGINEASKELGVAPATLRSWVQKSKRGPRSDGKPSYEDLEREVKRLRKEIGYIQDINEVLKKSTAIFSSGEMGGFR